MPSLFTYAQVGLHELRLLRTQFEAVLHEAAQSGDLRQAQQLRCAIELQRYEVRALLKNWAIGENALETDGFIMRDAVSGDGRSIAGLQITERQAGKCLSVNGRPWHHVTDTIETPVISDDGGVVAVNAEDASRQWRVLVNDEVWPDAFERHTHIAMDKLGRTVAAATGDKGRKTIVVNGRRWEAEFEDVSQPSVSADGSTVTAAVKTEAGWTVAVNGQLWDEAFHNVGVPVVNRDGTVIAVAAAEERGDFRVVVNGQPWREKFVIVWSVALNQSGSTIAAVRNRDLKHIRDQTIVVDEQSWGKPTWGRYDRIAVSADGSTVAAIEGHYKAEAVVVNGVRWPNTYHHLNGCPSISADGRTVAIAGRMEGGGSRVIVNGRPWPETFGYVYRIEVDPSGTRVMAVVTRDRETVRIVRPVD